MTTRAIIQLLVIVAGMVFEIMGTGYGLIRPFILSNYLGLDHTEPIRALVYNSFEHFKFISISLLMWLYPGRANDFKTDGLFVILAVLDFIDYLLVGNNIWISIHIPNIRPLIPISMNTFSVTVFCWYACRQWRINNGYQI